VLLSLLPLTALYCVLHRQPRGLGFIEFYDERDAEEALRGMDRMDLGGREVSRALLWYTDSSTPTVERRMQQYTAAHQASGAFSAESKEQELIDMAQHKHTRSTHSVNAAAAAIAAAAAADLCQLCHAGPQTP
jgi:hypothetical protein